MCVVGLYFFFWMEISNCWGLLPVIINYFDTMVHKAMPTSFLNWAKFVVFSPWLLSTCFHSSQALIVVISRKWYKSWMNYFLISELFCDSQHGHQVNQHSTSPYVYYRPLQPEDRQLPLASFSFVQAVLFSVLVLHQQMWR